MLSKVLYRGYRLAQRVFPVEAACLLVAPTETSAIALPSDHCTVGFLSEEHALGYAEAGQMPHSRDLITRLSEDRMACVGVESNGRLCAFAWLHEGLAERGMNVGSHPATATEIRLNEDAAFVFNVYTAPPHRGKGMMAAALNFASAELRRTRRTRWLVSTTDVTNAAARAGFRKCGFREVGRYYRYGIGNRSWGRYPHPTTPIEGFA